MDVGTKVRFTDVGRLGLMLSPDDSRFAGTVEEPLFVTSGDEGVYVGPHTNPNLSDWSLVTVERDGVTYFCPVHPSQFEVAP